MVHVDPAFFDTALQMHDPIYAEEIVHQDAIAGHVEACIAAYQANHSGGSSPEEESGEASDGAQLNKG